MFVFNRFIFNLNNRLQHHSLKKRLYMIQKIIKDLDTTEILKSIELDDDISSRTIKFNNILKHDQSIVNLKKKHGTYTGEINNEIIETERIARNRCGDNDMHEAVKMGDVGLIKHIYKTNPSSIDKKNNNGHNPIYVAFLEENEDAINIFREMGLIPGSLPN